MKTIRTVSGKMKSSKPQVQHMLRVIVIDPGNRKVFEEHAPAGADFLGYLQKTVGGYVDCISLIPTEDCWVHDEGRINGTKAVFKLPWYSDMFFGVAVIARHDREGNFISTNLQADKIREVCLFGEVEA